MSSATAAPTMEAPSMATKVFENMKGSAGIIFFGLSAAIFYIVSFVQTSKFVGSKDDWSLIQNQITKIWIYTLIGAVCLSIASLLYFIQDPNKTMYFLIVVSCLALGLSYSALAVAVISR
jgi:predicted membrane channel-forming protein YqfA (hemolysin III family)